jgi:TrmH family RNA methyltransferase
MLSKNRIKHINSLKINKYRKIHNEFVAEGTKIVMDLINSELLIKEIFSTKEWFDKYRLNLTQLTTPSTIISKAELNRISFLNTPQEVLAILDIPHYQINDKLFTNELVLMLDDIKDPGNLGTIIRSADWFGISNIICSSESVDLYNPKVVQATMGSIGRVKVHYKDLRKLLANTKQEYPVFGAFLEGQNINSIKPVDNGIIIIGNESKGISKNLLPYISKKIKIPSGKSSERYHSPPESLNAAMAATIICYVFRTKS